MAGARADVVVVTHNSRDHIRACVEPLSRSSELSVIVVDNDSRDGTLDALADLPVRPVQRRDNLGFSFACNVGWREGSSPVVVFLNPDATAEPAAILRLAELLEEDPGIGAVGPLLHDEHGIHLSQRRFPTAAISFAAAFFLPRVWPATPWSVDVGNKDAYRRSGSPDWVSGACIALRRDVLEQLGGFDERFFMYYEDMDLCRRVRNRGLDVRFEPSVSVTHIGAASAPRARLVPVMTESRLLYADKHRGPRGLFTERAATIVHGLTHALVTTQGPEARRGYVRSLAIACESVASLGRDAAGQSRPSMQA